MKSKKKLFKKLFKVCKATRKKVSGYSDAEKQELLKYALNLVFSGGKNRKKVKITSK